MQGHRCDCIGPGISVLGARGLRQNPRDHSVKAYSRLLECEGTDAAELSCIRLTLVKPHNKRLQAVLAAM